MNNVLINRPSPGKERNDFLFPILFLWGLVVFFIFLYIGYGYDFGKTNFRYYLLPWCLMTGIVTTAPSIYLIYKKQFDIFHPIVFASWGYFFPTFFIGGLVLAADLSQPWFLVFIHNEEYILPLTLVYVMLGYGGLSAGFFLPYGRKIGEYFGKKLPVWNWKSEQVVIPGVLLLLIGFGNNILAFSLGLIGYQRVEETEIYDGLVFSTTFFWLQASFLLWLYVFRSKKLNINHLIVMGLLLSIALLKAAFQGNRGSLLQIFVMIAFAFVYSGRKIVFKHKVWAGIIMIFALIGGMIYGTTFRSVKQGDSVVGMGEYTENVGTALSRISEQDFEKTLTVGLWALAERLDSVSPLGVIVANYETLQPYEESYGLDNNIWKDTITAFIPRIIWNDKPVASEPYKYADLYFNYTENSFSITPISDLLRNFGPVGVPLGMLLLGFVIRILYVMFKENQEFSYWKYTFFYMMLTHISYEGFYGTIIPYLMKVGVITFIGFLFFRFVIKKSDSV